MKIPKPKFMFAVVWADEAGQTINLFKTKQQAKKFYKAIEGVEVAKG